MPTAMIKFAQQAKDCVDDLAIKLNTDDTGVLKRALALLDFTIHHVKEGKSFLLKDEKGNLQPVDLTGII